MAELNIQMKHYNGVDWDSLFPRTKADIVMMNDGTTVQEKVTQIVHELARKATQVDINNAISQLIDSAPAALDTLRELAEALGNDPNFATTITNMIAQKVDKVEGKQLSTEDFTTALKNKLEGLPSDVYSKQEVDNLIGGKATTIVVSETEPSDSDMWFEVI